MNERSRRLLQISRIRSGGLPKISSAVGGDPHMVRDGTTALLFPFGDARVYADQIAWAITCGVVSSRAGSTRA
jgi:glycosyltransferase involved in cell wall biosynthesis